MSKVENEVFVTQYTHGLIGPETGFYAHIASGGRIRAVTPPGCWGPMITPDFKGGHEVTQPVYIDGAEVGDAVAIYIESVRLLSKAAGSGTMAMNQDAYRDDPFVDKKCPGCGKAWPETVLEGIGQDSIRCKECGAEASPFHFSQGYTVAFDKAGDVSIAVNREQAERFARNAWEWSQVPKTSRQYPILVYAASELAGLPVRTRPCIGNIGTIPSRMIPDSHNAGDFGSFLVGAHHEWQLTQEELDDVRTDAHLDCRDVREGAVFIAPVKVEGAGIYMGDAHSIMGRGEIAGHSIDITADITVRVTLIKGLSIEGPILLPNPSDLPEIVRPFASEEREAFQALGREIGVDPELNVAPLQFIGTGKDLNQATDNAVARAAHFLNVAPDEILNRGTVTGEVQISRLPGAVQLSLQVSRKILEEKGLWDIVSSHYAMA